MQDENTPGSRYCPVILTYRHTHTNTATITCYRSTDIYTDHDHRGHITRSHSHGAI